MGADVMKAISLVKKKKKKRPRVTKTPNMVYFVGSANSYRVKSHSPRRIWQYLV